MKKLVFITGLVALAALFFSCQSLGQAAEGPIEKLVTAGKITREQAKIVLDALDGGSFNWDLFWTAVLSVVSSVTGVNIMRNRARLQRGEPVGIQPKQP